MAVVKRVLGTLTDEEKVALTGLTVRRMGLQAAAEAFMRATATLNGEVISEWNAAQGALMARLGIQINPAIQMDTVNGEVWIMEDEPEPPPALLGSSTLPALIDLPDRQIQLGELVAAVHAESGLTVEAWNALPDEQRDAMLQQWVYDKRKEHAAQNGEPAADAAAGTDAAPEPQADAPQPDAATDQPAADQPAAQ